jgi:hypothetical protein
MSPQDPSPGWLPDVIRGAKRSLARLTSTRV